MDFADHAARVLEFEGGLVDNPKDPGGITKYGISARSYPQLGPDGIRSLTKEEAIEIYHRDYWLPVKGDELNEISPRLAMAIFDMAVHSGPAKAARTLQVALSGLERDATQDGIIGSQTLAIIHSINVEKLIVYFLAERASFLMALKASEDFHRGWMRRLFSL